MKRLALMVLLISATIALLLILVPQSSDDSKRSVKTTQMQQQARQQTLFTEGYMTVRGRVDRVIDGDTIVAHLEVLPGLELHGMHVRIEGINAPEVSTQEGREARNFLQGYLLPGTEIKVMTRNQDKYGRVLGFLITAAGENIGDVMINGGFAKPYKVR